MLLKRTGTGMGGGGVAVAACSCSSSLSSPLERGLAVPLTSAMGFPPDDSDSSIRERMPVVQKANEISRGSVTLSAVSSSSVSIAERVGVS